MNGRTVLLLVVLASVYNVPQLVAGSIQYDGVDVHYASQRYLSDEIHAGRLPFWTPYIFSGFPFLADLQVGTWYPLNWPFFLAGVTPRSIGGELLIHSIIATLGAYMLGKRLLGSGFAAVATAIFYGLSGWFAAHSQHVGMFDAAAWLPWLVLLVKACVDGLTPKLLALAGLLGAAIALPGHFQLALYTFTFVTVWAVAEAITQKSRSAAGRSIAGVVAAALWGGLIAAVMIVPAAELVQNSIRTQLNAQSVDIGYFHAGSLLTLVDPDYYGLLSGNYRGPGDSTQHYFYAGILLLPAVILGLRNRAIARTAAFIGLPFLWYAFGPRGGLFDLLVRLPGFSGVELPMHGWFLPALGLALLGGAGVATIERYLKPVWRMILIAFMFVDVVAINQLSNPLAYARQSFQERFAAPVRELQSESDAAQPPVERLYGPPLTAVGYRNSGLQTRIPTTYGYNPLELVGYAAYENAAATNSRLINGFAANYAVGGDGAIHPLSGARPLAYFAQSVVSADNEATAQNVLLELDPARATLVTGTPPPIQSDPSSTVTVVQHSDDALTIRYASATPNLIRVAVAAFPGWRAQLDGSDLPVLTVDHAFLGVLVPAGAGEVRLVFAPRFFAVSAILSGLALVAAAVVVAASGKIIGLRSKPTARQQYQAATLR